MPQLTTAIIEAAISGFEAQKKDIDVQIAELRAMLTGGDSVTPSGPAATISSSPGKRKKFSAATLKRMKEAQQRRWSKIKGEGAENAPKPATKEVPKAKRTLSAQGRQNIIDALRRRMAANRAEAASASQPPRRMRRRPEKR
jgi:hypothetical protein